MTTTYLNWRGPTQVTDQDTLYEAISSLSTGGSTLSGWPKHVLTLFAQCMAHAVPEKNGPGTTAEERGSKNVYYQSCTRGKLPPHGHPSPLSSLVSDNQRQQRRHSSNPSSPVAALPLSPTKRICHQRGTEAPGTRPAFTVRCASEASQSCLHFTRPPPRRAPQARAARPPRAAGGRGTSPGCTRWACGWCR